MTVERFDERNEMIRADAVKVGDLLNLQPGDAYADPDNDPTSELEFEVALVGGVERDGPSRMLIYTSLVNFACPADHIMHLAGRESEAVEF